MRLEFYPDSSEFYFQKNYSFRHYEKCILQSISPPPQKNREKLHVGLLN